MTMTPFDGRGVLQNVVFDTEVHIGADWAAWTWFNATATFDFNLDGTVDGLSLGLFPFSADKTIPGFLGTLGYGSVEGTEWVYGASMQGTGFFEGPAAWSLPVSIEGTISPTISGAGNSISIVNNAILGDTRYIFGHIDVYYEFTDFPGPPPPGVPDTLPAIAGALPLLLPFGVSVVRRFRRT